MAYCVQVVLYAKSLSDNERLKQSYVSYDLIHIYHLHMLMISIYLVPQ